MLKLDADFISLWPKSPSFQELMAIQGEVFSRGVGREVIKFSVLGHVFFIKKHVGIGWLEIIKELIVGKKPVLGSKNEWLAISHLNQIGINTLTPVGFGIEGCNPAKQQSFIITKALENTISLEKLAVQWSDKSPSFKEKKQLIEQVATLTYQLHQSGFVHRDYYICHILLEQNSQKLFLIDLHRARIFKHIPNRWLIKELSSLYFSTMLIGLTRHDRLRFLKAYTQLPLAQLLKQQNKFWYAVEQKAKHLMHKAIRKGIV